MVASHSIILSAADQLTHEEACRLSDLALQSAARMVLLDLSGSTDASTSAFARLVLLRRDLLAAGRDLWLAGLRGRAARLFEVHRLDAILPRQTDLPAKAVAPKSSRRPTPAKSVQRSSALAC